MYTGRQQKEPTSRVIGQSEGKGVQQFRMMNNRINTSYVDVHNVLTNKKKYRSETSRYANNNQYETNVAKSNSSILQCYTPYQPPVTVSEDGIVDNVTCLSDWRVNGKSVKYTNYHTIAYSLLCEGAKNLIKDQSLSNAIEILREEMSFYYSEISQKGGRSDKSASEAEAVMNYCYNIIEPYTEVSLTQHVQGLLILQQHTKFAFHQIGSGDASSNGEKESLHEMKEHIDHIKDTKKYNKNDVMEISQKFVNLADTRNVQNSPDYQTIMFYLLDVLDEILPFNESFESDNDNEEDESEYLEEFLITLREEIYEDIYNSYILPNIESDENEIENEDTESLIDETAGETNEYFQERRQNTQAEQKLFFQEFLQGLNASISSVNHSIHNGLISTLRMLLYREGKDLNNYRFRNYLKAVNNSLETDLQGLVDIHFFDIIAEIFEVSFTIFCIDGTECISVDFGDSNSNLQMVIWNGLFYPLSVPADL